jgi:hypothetical protein
MYKLKYKNIYFFILHADVLVVYVYLNSLFQLGKSISDSNICDVLF